MASSIILGGPTLLQAFGAKVLVYSTVNQILESYWKKSHLSPLTPDRPQVKRPPPSYFLVFMGFHMVPLLKRMVLLKILYIQKSDELLLETVECSHWWKIYIYKKSFTRFSLH